VKEEEGAQGMRLLAANVVLSVEQNVNKIEVNVYSRLKFTCLKLISGCFDTQNGLGCTMHGIQLLE